MNTCNEKQMNKIKPRRGKSLNEMEILPIDKESKILVVKMLTNLRERVNELGGNFNKGIERIINIK